MPVCSCSLDSILMKVPVVLPMSLMKNYARQERYLVVLVEHLGMEAADALFQDEDLVAGVPADLAAGLLDAVKVCLRALGGLNDELVAGLLRGDVLLELCGGVIGHVIDAGVLLLLELLRRRRSLVGDLGERLLELLRAHFVVLEVVGHQVVDLDVVLAVGDLRLVSLL